MELIFKPLMIILFILYSFFFFILTCSLIIIAINKWVVYSIKCLKMKNADIQLEYLPESNKDNIHIEKVKPEKLNFLRVKKRLKLIRISGNLIISCWVKMILSELTRFCVSGRQTESRDSVPDVWAVLARGVRQGSAACLRGVSTPGHPHGDNRNTHVPPQTLRWGGDSLQLHARWEWVSLLYVCVGKGCLWSPDLCLSLSVIYVDGSHSAALRQYLYTMLDGSDPNQGRYAIGHIRLWVKHLRTSLGPIKAV